MLLEICSPPKEHLKIITYAQFEGGGGANRVCYGEFENREWYRILHKNPQFFFLFHTALKSYPLHWSICGNSPFPRL